jgi:hypothetical protein
MNVTLNVTYKIVRYILLKKDREFTQLEIHNNTKSSLGRINDVVNWLISRNYVEKNKAKYYVINPSGIISLFPLYRNMKDLLVYNIQIKADKEKIFKNLPKESILCLDSALDKYSKYFRSNRICIYHKKPQLVKSVFEPYSGGIITLEVYKPDMDLLEDVENGFTTRLRTIIDMTCDGKTYVTKDLFEDLWGIKFG